MLERLLRKVAAQRTDGNFTFEIVVCDNDEMGSGKAVVEKLTELSAVPVQAVIQPIKNIALARNTAISKASGEFIAFIDDDEFPDENWLLTLLTTILRTGVSGALGPVLPHFDQKPPQWVIKGRQFERPRHVTGFQLQWQECRTGNVLFKRSILKDESAPFRAEFGTGGEDQDFFRRMVQTGERFVWCDEAPVWETVPPERWDLKIMLSRALLRGKNTLRHKDKMPINLAKSLLATPCYVLALPIMALMGRHLLVRYLVRTCDHLGRLLAFVRLNPVDERVG